MSRSIEVKSSEVQNTRKSRPSLATIRDTPFSLKASSEVKWSENKKIWHWWWRCWRWWSLGNIRCRQWSLLLAKTVCLSIPFMLILIICMDFKWTRKPHRERSLILRIILHSLHWAFKPSCNICKLLVNSHIPCYITS